MDSSNDTEPRTSGTCRTPRCMAWSPSQREWPPPTAGRRGPGRSYDPFYQFERVARDDGKPYMPPEPKAELRLLALLGSRAAVAVVGCLLAVVVVNLRVLLALRCDRGGHASPVGHAQFQS